VVLFAKVVSVISGENQMFIKQGALIGQYVRLDPIQIHDVTALQQAVADGESWTLWYAFVPKPEQMADYVAAAVAGAATGNLAYTIRLQSSGQVVGTSRYYLVDASHKRACIGYTWYAASVRRTAVNTESKLLLLSHLFESGGAIAAEFRTHVANQASRSAIERLGAKQDGILRNHMIMPDGSYRDTAVYSIIANEWPEVKAQLQLKLQSPSA